MEENEKHDDKIERANDEAAIEAKTEPREGWNKRKAADRKRRARGWPF